MFKKLIFLLSTLVLGACGGAKHHNVPIEIDVSALSIIPREAALNYLVKQHNESPLDHRCHFEENGASERNAITTNHKKIDFQKLTMAKVKIIRTPSINTFLIPVYASNGKSFSEHCIIGYRTKGSVSDQELSHMANMNVTAMLSLGAKYSPHLLEELQRRSVEK